MRHVQLLDRAFTGWYSYAIKCGKPFSDEQMQTMMDIRDYLKAVNHNHADDEQTFSGSPTLGDDEL